MNKKKLNSKASGRCFVRASFENYENFSQKSPFLPDSSSVISEDPVSDIFINTCFDKNQLKTVIAWFLDKYGEKKTVDLVETLKQVGFHQATRAGVSLGVDDLEIPPQKAPLLSEASVKMLEVNQALIAGNLTNVEKSQRLIDTWNQTSETLRQAAVQNFRTTNPVNPVYMMAFSGARGNISQVRQLVAMRGLMADPQGAILEFPIQSNFREGLTVTEYLISCFGARKGLVDTALRTATSGYLTRRLVDAVQHVVIHVTNCQTTKGILIKEKNLEQKLLGRVLLNDLSFDSTTIVKKNTLISGRLAKKIAGHHKEIFVRSPLTCQTEKSVCQLCYGLDLAQGKLVSLGEAVGIIAAQSIGEPGTQLTMRTFHTGGVGVFSDQAMKALSAPFSGKIDFLSSLPGLFVRTLHGNIVYLLKHKSTDNHQIFLRLKAFDLPSKSLEKTNISTGRDRTPTGGVPSFWEKEGKEKEEREGKKEKINFFLYEIKHGEVPAGSLLWVKQGEHVKKGQLLIQASRLQASRQEMPESTHPVRAILSGEIFFESIKTRLIEKGKLVKKKTAKNRFHHTKEKLSKEITPTIPFLRELGNFWVFSCFVQKEIEMANSFLRKGDLISPETPVQQYNFQVPFKGQLKETPASFVFTEPAFQSRVSNIHYSEKFYFFITTHQNLLSYTTNSRATGLTWYPFFQTFKAGRFTKKNIPFSHQNHRFQKGYCLRLPLRNHETSSFFREINEKTNENAEKMPEIRFLWSPHKVFQLAKNESFYALELDSGFILAGETGTVSKTGLFQFHSFPFVLKKTNLSQKQSWPTKQSFGGRESGRNQSGRNQRRGSKNLFFRQNPISEKETTKVLKKGKGKRLVWLKENLFKTKFLKNDLTWCSITQNAPEKVESSSPAKTVLKRAQKILTPQSSQKFIEKKQGWFYVSDISKENFKKSQLLGVVLEPGKNFENISFSKSYVSLNLLSTKNVFILKRKEKKQQSGMISTNAKTICFWERASLLSKVAFFSYTRNFLTWSPSTKPLVSKRTHWRDFCFFKKQDLNQPLPQNRVLGEGITSGNKFVFETPVFQLQKKRRLFHLVFIQKNFYQNLPDRQLFYQKYVLENKNSFQFSLNSPLFAKQRKSQKGILVKNRLMKNNHLRFELVSPPLSGWMSIASFFKVDLEVQTSKVFGKLDEFQQKISTSGLHSGILKDKGMSKKSGVCPQNKVWGAEKENVFSIQGVSIFFSRRVQLENADAYRFQTFQDGWVLPDLTVTRGFILSRKLGEFNRIQKKQDDFHMSLLQTQDLLCLKLPNVQKENTQNRGASCNVICGVGTRVRWGQELVDGFAVCSSGQIMKITTKKLTLRKGTPLLASLRGLLHVTQGDMIQKNDILITLRSRRLQTEDIVQGIPKIEQLFEARETQGGELLQNNMHMLLKKFFHRAILVKTVPEAVELSITYIQKFLVENILQAYSNQGVHIAEKHVEIVVRQMTSRIRITNGGDSGFLPGEFVQLRVIERINDGLALAGHRPADYEPMILGITKSVLQSESFLLAASFQQVSKVLVRSALAKKTDFLRGLHENLLVGQPIPAGTGILSIPTSSSSFKP